ncbi:hypothetical protein FJZ36_09110 [Candidatus Poribacteria bacterium]|nr:hypothetical protein [Candidatus Poribacteria bacterium]
MRVRYLGLAFALLAGIWATSAADAKQLYGSDFQNDAIGKAPAGWEVGFKGNTAAEVIADPKDGGNKVLASSKSAANASRHDVGGSIYVVGDAGWTDYIIEYDAYFPEEFYMGTLFRFQEGNMFYLFDRRSGGESGNFDFWFRNGGAWNAVLQGGKFATKPQTWYRFRLKIAGDTFEAYAGAKADNPAFDSMKPFHTAKNNALKAGKFGLYGLIYIDNLVIGETTADLVLPVEPKGRLAVTWAGLREER